MWGAPRRGSVLVATLLAASLAACGGEPDGPAGGSGPTTPSASSTSSPGPTDPTGSGVDPAAGKQIDLEHVTLNAPQGWTLERSSGVSVTANAPTGRYYAFVTVYDQPVGPGADSLRNLAELQISSQGEIRDPEILPNTEIAGEPVYHIGGPVGGSLVVDGYGPSVDGALVDIYFTFITTVPKPEREKIIDSVLASVEWNL